MFKSFIKKLFVFIIYGFIWLFIFSIPLSSGKNLFEIGYDKIVDTKPVHWILSKVSKGMKKTENNAKEATENAIDKIESEMKK
ncbi:hypothetical protein [Silvanigrella aquatica]|uniref:Uncharacterized protein n=1 Tax=Silvanigrella aquatica TaxID=1915309 RepID=A0A1L4CXN7_9BACT|nr:hypothetical protein [Silvanigrella aquatica]APJ02706.1 hypothetical protein AXG55_01670 [Silvanigrella aquatica]